MNRVLLYTALSVGSAVFVLLKTAWATHVHAPTTVAKAAHNVLDPLLHSGSLVVAALLLPIGLLAFAVYILYRDGKKEKEDRRQDTLKTLEVLRGLEEAIRASAERNNHGN